MAGIAEYVGRHSPKQSEIVVALQKRTPDGELRPGYEVPSLLELAQLNKASTRTVQSAMHHLRRLGYIQSVPGVGSRVSAAPPHLCNFALALPNVPHSFYKGLCVEATTISKDSESDFLPRRISSFQLDMGHGPGDGYVKLTAGTPPLTIKVFTITDQSTGSPRFTNSALLDAFISARGDGGEIDGYLVTTSDMAPAEGWLPEPPTTAILTSTGDVTLYAWSISPSYPQSNGRIERWHGSLKRECIRPKTPLSLDDARRIIGSYVEHYNNVRLHSAIDYVAPKDKLEGRAESILSARDAKLAAAREHRRVKRQQMRQNELLTTDTKRAILSSAGETEASVAGERTARDNRSGCDGYPSLGAVKSGSPGLPKQDVRSIPHPSKNSTSQPPEESLISAGGLSNSG